MGFLLFLLPRCEEQLSVHCQNIVVRVKDYFLCEDGESHELDANYVPASRNSCKSELPIKASRCCEFFARQSIGGGHGCTGNRRFSAANRSANFVNGRHGLWHLLRNREQGKKS